MTRVSAYHPGMSGGPQRIVDTHAKALEINLDRQQWFAILEASEGRPVA